MQIVGLLTGPMSVSASFKNDSRISLLFFTAYITRIQYFFFDIFVFSINGSLIKIVIEVMALREWGLKIHNANFFF